MSSWLHFRSLLLKKNEINSNDIIGCLSNDTGKTWRFDFLFILIKIKSFHLKKKNCLGSCANFEQLEHSRLFHQSMERVYWTSRNMDWCNWRSFTIRIPTLCDPGFGSQYTWTHQSSYANRKRIVRPSKWKPAKYVNVFIFLILDRERRESSHQWLLCKKQLMFCKF